MKRGTLTKRHGAAADTAPAEGYHRTLLESTSDIVALVTRGGTVRYASPAVERVLGYSPEERVGRSAFEWVHPGDAAAALSAFTELVRDGGNRGPMEVRVRHRDGNWRIIEVTAGVLPRLEGIVVTGRDVTERRTAETARQQLSAILDATPDIVLTADPHGRILYANESARRVLGIGEADLRAFNLPDFFPPPATRRIVSDAIPGALRSGMWRGETALAAGDDGELQVSLVLVAHRDAAGHLQFLSATARDIGESKRAEAALRESEQRFRQVAENIEEVFWLVDCATWRVLYVSPAFERVWGRSCASLYADPRRLLLDVHPEDRAGMQGLPELFMGSSEREYRIRRADGAECWIRSRSFPVRNAAGEVYRVAGISEDVTRRKKTDDQLLHLALHDPLTGLPNRASFIKRLTRALERSERDAEDGFAVLFVDLDRFKLVNDSFGHAKGDALLVEISRRLEACVRPEDLVARLAGDEFGVLLHHTPGVADAARVAERILATLGEPFTLGELEVYTGASLGIVPSDGYEQPEDLLRDADIAMYRAKMVGRGMYRVFDAAMHAEVVGRLRLETDLRRGLDHDEFRLHYQPIVSLETGEVVGMEALLRWVHPERGLLAPAEFIAVAEETGAIIPLGWWGLREACTRMQQWTREVPHAADLSISVNLSGKHFSQRDLVRRVGEVLDDTGLDPRRLHLEITESVIIENAGAARGMIDELSAIGVQIQIDDFGTGYSSLSYLDRFPIDSLKIDRSLVARIGPDGTGGELVRTVAMLARDLGIAVIAEGVETEAQLRQLRRAGCDFAQGYFFSVPLSAGGAEELLRAMPRW
jgi:diguanylate cyclase (GGDEF)-like protein/PAS domain S-box-containing protein